MTAAIIDLGSNSARLGIYRKTENEIITLEELRCAVRLSDGLVEEDMLKEAAMDRAVTAFLKFKEIIAKYRNIVVKCVATEAMRRAKNAAEFQARIKRDTGIEIEIIDGERETRYGLFGAKLSAKCDNFYMLDTGGGSFELALCQNGLLKAHACLPYGAVVLTDTFRPDINGKEEILLFMQSVMAKLSFVSENNYPIVLLGGSNRVIGKLYKGVVTESKLDGTRIPKEAVLRIINQIITTPPAKRGELIGMERSRIDIITAGLAPLLTLIEKVQAKELIISTKSVRDGLAKEMLS